MASSLRVSVRRVLLFALFALGSFVAVVLAQMWLGIGPLGQALELLRGGGDDEWGVSFSDAFLSLGSRHRWQEAWIIWPAILAVVGALFTRGDERPSWLALGLLAVPAALIAGFLAWPRTLYLLLAYTGWLMLISWLSRRIWARASGSP